MFDQIRSFVSVVDQVGSELSSLSLHGDQTFDAFSLREREISSDQVATLQQAFAFACNYAENPEDWVMLTGGYGCGKTHLAAAIANAVSHAAGVRMRQLPMSPPRILAALKQDG